MVRISRASFSAVQSIAFWPVGIFGRGFLGGGGVGGVDGVGWG